MLAANVRRNECVRKLKRDLYTAHYFSGVRIDLWAKDGYSLEVLCSAAHAMVMLMPSLAVGVKPSLR